MGGSVKVKSRQLTEFNVVNLGLISIQSRLPDAVRRGWRSASGEGEYSAGIAATTGHASGVPHGIANDVMAALITESVAAEHGGAHDFEISVPELARGAGLPLNGETYERVDVSLNQLRHTVFEIWNRWRTPLHRVDEKVTVTCLPTLATRTTTEIGFQGRETRLYVLRLDESITRSISGALTLALNPELMQGLSSPTARGLYRFLEAARRNPEDVTVAAPELTLRGVELIERTRLLGHSGRVAKTLEVLTQNAGPIMQLRTLGYLDGFDTTGRGDNTLVKFRFAAATDLQDMVALRLLNEAGVTGSHARTLAQSHRREVVECALWMLEQRQKSRYAVKHPPGLLIKMLTDGSAKANLPAFRGRSKPVTATAAPRKARQREEDRTEGAPEQTPEQTVEQAQEAARKLVGSMLAMRKLTPTQAEGLYGALGAGRLSSRDVLDIMQMTHAKLNEWWEAYQASLPISAP